MSFSDFVSRWPAPRLVFTITELGDLSVRNEGGTSVHNLRWLVEDVERSLVAIDPDCSELVKTLEEVLLDERPEQPIAEIECQFPLGVHWRLRAWVVKDIRIETERERVGAPEHPENIDSGNPLSAIH